LWLLAIAVATAGASALQLAGWVDLSKAIYTSPRFNLAVVHRGRAVVRDRHDLGSGCGSKTLIRIGSGNLKSLVVALVLAITAYMTLKGILAVFRVAALDSVGATFAGPQDLPSLLAPAFRHREEDRPRRAQHRDRGGPRRVRVQGARVPDFEQRARRRGRGAGGGWRLVSVRTHRATCPKTRRRSRRNPRDQLRRMESFSFVAPLPICSSC